MSMTGPGNDRQEHPSSREQRYPRWTWILAGIVAVISVIGYFIVGDRGTITATDIVPRQIGPQMDPAPVTSPTPATPSPSPEPATPVRPPTPVE